jgi:hypothetical protein
MEERNGEAVSTGAAERTELMSPTKGPARVTYDLRAEACQPAPRSHKSEPGSLRLCSTCRTVSGPAVRGMLPALGAARWPLPSSTSLG